MPTQKISNLTDLLIGKKRTYNKLIKLTKLNKVFLSPVLFYDLLFLKKVNLKKKMFNKLLGGSKKKTQKLRHVNSSTNNIFNWKIYSNKENRPHFLKFTDMKQTSTKNCFMWCFGFFWIGIILGNVFLIRKILCKTPRDIFVEKGIQCELLSKKIFC